MRRSSFPEVPDVRNDPPNHNLEIHTDHIPEGLRKYCWPNPLSSNYYSRSHGLAHGILVWHWNENKTKVDITLYYYSPHRDDPDINAVKLLSATLSETNLARYYRLNIKIGKRNISWLVKDSELNDYFYSQDDQKKSLTKVAYREAYKKITEDYSDFMSELESQDEDQDVEDKKANCSKEDQSIQQYADPGFNISLDDVGRGDSSELLRAMKPIELIFYFAYGLEMNEEIMKQKIGSWYLRLPAELHGFKLIFSVQEVDNPYAGLPNIQYDKDNPNVVYGVVYLLNAEQKEKLDLSCEKGIYKSGSCCYTRYWERKEGVFLQDGSFISDVFAYFGEKKYIVDKLKPYKATIEQMLEAADMLPPDYAKMLRKIKTFD